MSRWPRFINVRLVGILLFAVILSTIDLRALGRVLAGVRWEPVALAMLLQPLALLIKAWRWSLLLKAQKVTITVWRTFIYYVVSGYFGIVTPGRVGELWKSLALKRHEGIPLTVSLPSTILDRAFDFYTYFMVGLYFVVRLGMLPEFGGASWVVIGLLVIAPFVMSRQSVVRRLGKWVFLNRLSRWYSGDPRAACDQFVKSCLNLVSPVLIPSTLLTIAGATILFLQFHLMLSALHLELPFSISMMVPSVLKFLSNVPVSIAGLGTRDAALLWVFHRFELPAEQAVGLSFLLLLVDQITVAAIGLFACQTVELEIPSAVPASQECAQTEVIHE